MRKIISVFLIVPIISSSLAYAGNKSFDVKYTDEQFDKEPAFNCSTNAEDSLLKPVSVSITADTELAMIGGNAITELNAGDLKKYYFQAGHKPSKEAHVKVTLSGSSIDEETDLQCKFGKDGKNLYHS